MVPTQSKRRPTPLDNLFFDTASVEGDEVDGSGPVGSVVMCSYELG